ncbi:MAG: sortase [Candidatus Saccharimonadales bacterium]
MTSNPLFPDNTSAAEPNNDAAVELIRAKVSRAYGEEPNTAVELQEAARARTPSKHQKYMRELSGSGKSLAEIQTAWHHYYTTLPDSEKHEVWQEFYAANQNTPYQKLFQKQQQATSRRAIEATQPVIPLDLAAAQNQVVVASHESYANNFEPDPYRSAKLKSKIVKRVSANGKLQAKHHFQSVIFGLGMGFLVMVIFLFSFFNEYIIAPFIQPSRNVSATPVIVSNTATDLTATPKVIIPKINIQIPIDFTLTSNAETVIENSLSNGTVHYPSTVLPGQIGNVAIFGHSSSNIFNSGKYKFAFALLHRLTTGDVFYITYGGKIYAYQVFAREVVPPSQVSVLSDTKGQPSTAVLITCDPPGFSTNRLVVWGQQISPDPTTNTTRQPVQNAAAPAEIAGNGPTLWSKFVNWVEFWN